MRHYQAVRIAVHGKPTYGDVYRSITSEKELHENDIIDIDRGERVLILFEEQGQYA